MQNSSIVCEFLRNDSLTCSLTPRLLFVRTSLLWDLLRFIFIIHLQTLYVHVNIKNFFGSHVLICLYTVGSIMGHFLKWDTVKILKTINLMKTYNVILSLIFPKNKKNCLKICISGFYLRIWRSTIIFISSINPYFI